MSQGLPENNAEYKTLEYWEERYSELESTFDWFKDFSSIEKQLTPLLPCKECSIINLGCGNSLFSQQLFAAGWMNITNVDYSSKCIEYMSHLAPEMQWIICDIFKMDNTFAQKSFDCAVDKGTLDALLTVKHDPWDPATELLDEIKLYMLQVAKIIKKGGKFIHITFAQPHFRKRFLQVDGLEVAVHALLAEGGSFEYFCYVATKI